MTTTSGFLVDSHCHLDRLKGESGSDPIADAIGEAHARGVDHLLCVSINLEQWPAMRDAVATWDEVSISVGVHPNEREGHDPDVDELVELARHDRVVAIGETGLDYFRNSRNDDLEWQRDRFRTHIAAARACSKPLIIHTREAREDTLKIMREENAAEARGVMHCFAEDWDTAKRAMDMDFYISFSGIVTFNSAKELQEVAKRMPLDRMLVETDSPWLAPVPLRGKPNQPANTRYVAEHIAALRGVDYETVRDATTRNFFELFRDARR